MNRRSFLGFLGLGAAALTLDPEKLLWVPGKKKIFLPVVEQWKPIRLLVGIANQNIAAGQYGSVQIYGVTSLRNDVRIGDPSPVRPFVRPTEPRLFRRVQALRDITPGSLVYSDDVDAGTAPLWHTAGTPEVLDEFQWKDYSVLNLRHSKTYRTD